MGERPERLTHPHLGRASRSSQAHPGRHRRSAIHPCEIDFDRSITEWSLNSALLFQDSTTSRHCAQPSLAEYRHLLCSPLARGSHSTCPGILIPLVLPGNPNLAPSILWSSELGATRDPRWPRPTGADRVLQSNHEVISSPPAASTPPLAAPARLPVHSLRRRKM